MKDRGGQLRRAIGTLDCKTLRVAWSVTRRLRGTDRRIVRDYFNTVQSRKLHVGCGSNILDGWLNSDCYPVSSRILHLDATSSFPFEDDVFDYAYSEHLIEHLSYQQGQTMLAESFRVLRAGGKIRVSTPDLAFLIDLYRRDKSDLQLMFIRHSTDTWIEYAPSYDDVFVINNYMRAWGHRFIYDRKVLAHALEMVGFVDIRSFDVCESTDDVMRGLENVSRKPAGLLALESLVLEGTKPL